MTKKQMEQKQKEMEEKLKEQQEKIDKRKRQIRDQNEAAKKNWYKANCKIPNEVKNKIDYLGLSVNGAINDALPSFLELVEELQREESNPRTIYNITLAKTDVYNPHTASKTTKDNKNINNEQNRLKTENLEITKEEQDLLDWYRGGGRVYCQERAESYNFNTTPKDFINWLLMKDENMAADMENGRLLEICLEDEEAASLRQMASINGYSSIDEYIHDFIRHKCGLTAENE